MLIVRCNITDMLRGMARCVTRCQKESAELEFVAVLDGFHGKTVFRAAFDAGEDLCRLGAVCQFS